MSQLVWIHLMLMNLWNLSLYAQTPSIKFDHLTVDHGLSQNTVNCILQDSRGFMWFGTQDGLNKFNGYTTTVYKHEPLDTTSISDNYIRYLYEDRDGFLWIGTENGGLNRFDRASETFKRFQNNPDNHNSLSDNKVWSIQEDNHGVLWIGTHNAGLSRLDQENERFTHYRFQKDNPTSLSDDRIKVTYMDREGALWVGTEDGGINRFDFATRTFKRYQYEADNPYSLSHNRAWAIHEDLIGALWIATWNGLNKFDRVSGKFIHFPLSIDWDFTEVTSIHEDQTGMFWLGTTSHGLCQFDPITEAFRFFEHDSNNPFSLNSNLVLSVYEDYSGLVWIGTWGGGVSRFNPKPKFTHYTHVSDDPHSLSNKSIRAIYEDRERVLWIGSYGGLDKFDRKAGKTEHYRTNLRDPYSLQNNNAYAIEEDLDGTLWIGSEGGGLHHFDPVAEKFTEYRHDPEDPSSLSNGFVYVIYADRDSILWVGTGNGLSRLSWDDRKTGHFTRYQHNPDNPVSIGGRVIGSILEDQRGMFWIGTDRAGFSRFDRNTETFTSYRHDPDNTNSLSNDRVKSIHEDKSGVLWIGTGGGGLNRFDSTTDTFVHYTEKDGLPNNVIYGVLEDDHGYLWLSTNKGISRFNPEAETFRNYDTGDGLQGDEFNSRAYFESVRGEMFFGGINGLNAFYPHSIVDDPFPPPIVFTDFQILNQSVPIGTDTDEGAILQRHITETDAITLSHRENVFSIEFAALSYAAPGDNQYLYKMEGFNTDWIPTGPEKRFTTYTNLPAGDFKFRVKASNHDGVWNEEGASLSITITPPPWKTWWAYIIYVLAGIGVVAGTIQWRLWQMKRRTKVLEKLIAERTAEIHRHEEELREGKERFEKFFENQPDYCYMISSEGIILNVNTSALKALGYERRELVGRPLNSIYSSESHSKMDEYFSEWKETGRLRDKEIVIVSKHGEKRTVLLNVDAVKSQNGTILHSLSVQTDITERKKLEDALQERLEDRNKKLTTQAMFMAQRTESMINIVDRLHDVYAHVSAEEKPTIRRIIDQLEKQVTPGHEWDEFEVWFGEVHNSFYQTLTEQFPDLSRRELKICAFLKLKLSTKEIASLTNLSVKTIEVYRSKLRKKLNVCTGVNLVKFISEI